MGKHRFRELVLAHPFELFIGTLCFLVGLPVLLRKVQPGTIIDALPLILQYGWGCSLTGGGLLVLTGLMGRAFHAQWYRGGMATERAGMMLLTSATAVYALVLAVTGVLQSALVTVAILVALSMACAARTYAIRRVLRKLEDPRVKGADGDNE